MNKTATPKPGRFDEEWAKLDLAPMFMRGTADLPEASLILTNVKPELTVGGILQTRTMLAPFGCEEVQDETMGSKEDDEASTGGMFSLDFNFLSDFENGTDTLEATTEPADEGTSTLQPPSAFKQTNRNLPESSPPSNSKNTEIKKLLMESPRRRRIEGTARVPFLGTLPEKE